MDNFIDALLSDKTDKIPDEYDWFAPLLGDWDCDYYDEPSTGHKRHVKGEWIFRRILEGAGIQDIFIFPSRATKEAEPQPDGEYGSSFRMFNKAEGYYDVVYTCDHCMKGCVSPSRATNSSERSFPRKMPIGSSPTSRLTVSIGKTSGFPSPERKSWSAKYSGEGSGVHDL